MGQGNFMTDSLGYRVIRFTARQLAEEPLVVIGRLAAALALTSRQAA